MYENQFTALVYNMGDYNGLGALPRHVDRKALYTDLEARVRYLQQFIGFTAGQSSRISCIDVSTTEAVQSISLTQWSR